MNRKSTATGFTIVELLIVVVVIAILAAIVIVAYNGVTNRAKESAAQSVVRNASTKLQAFAAENSDTYPASLTTVGISDTANDVYQYTVNNSSSPRSFCVSVTRSGVSYMLTQSGAAPTAGTCGSPTIPTSTVYGTASPGSLTLYNDGSTDIALGTLFYSTGSSFSIKGGRVYVPSVPSGSPSLTICYVVSWWSGGSIVEPTWTAVPSSITNQCSTISGGSVQAGWNEATFPNRSTVQPFANGVNGTSVWVIYYFSGGKYYIHKPSTGDVDVQSANNSRLYIPNEVGFAGSTQRSAFGGRSGGSSGWSKHFYGIDIMTEGP